MRECLVSLSQNEYLPDNHDQFFVSAFDSFIVGTVREGFFFHFPGVATSVDFWVLSLILLLFNPRYRYDPEEILKITQNTKMVTNNQPGPSNASELLWNNMALERDY